MHGDSLFHDFIICGPLLVSTVQLIVISRILRNFGCSCTTLCYIESRQYFLPYRQDGWMYYTV